MMAQARLRILRTMHRCKPEMTCMIHRMEYPTLNLAKMPFRYPLMRLSMTQDSVLRKGQQRPKITL